MLKPPAMTSDIYPKKPEVMDFSAFKVLVVDDSRTLRLILAQQLGALGIQRITEATDGLKALELVKSTAFDLMLLDMEMPELDGLGVLEILRSDPALQPPAVIVISGASALERAYKCIEMGAEDYLPKPFNPVLLKARIFSSFEKKRLRDLERERLVALDQKTQRLEFEQLKTEKLMLNILPRPIAERLKRGEQHISAHYPEVSILFSDLIGFTEMASGVSATELVRLLNDLFTRFDRRAESLGLEKIKTIGDAYMAAGGLPIPRADHAEICADMALGMFDDLAAFNQEHGRSLDMRIGINSGPVVAGVIGYTKFSYDLWGNTVNTASRMESTSLPGRVQVAPATHAALRGKFSMEVAGQVMCKGIGQVHTHFLLPRTSRPG
jgi:class 3 adenylate cyclase